jgi:hypothetical protein
MEDELLGADGEIPGLDNEGQERTKEHGYFLKRFSKAWRASVWRGGPLGGAEPGAFG